MIITKKIEVDVPDMHTRIRAFLDTIDGVTTKLIKAGLNPQTVYAFTKEGVNASYWQLDRYLKPLGSSVEALGVVFPAEPIKLLAVEEAPYDTTIMFWVHSSPFPFVGMRRIGEGWQQLVVSGFSRASWEDQDIAGWCDCPKFEKEKENE